MNELAELSKVAMAFEYAEGLDHFILRPSRYSRKARKTVEYEIAPEDVTELLYKINEAVKRRISFRRLDGERALGLARHVARKRHGL